MMESSGIAANVSPTKSIDGSASEKNSKSSKAVHIIDELLNTEEEYGTWSSLGYGSAQDECIFFL